MIILKSIVDQIKVLPEKNEAQISFVQALESETA